MASLWNMPPAGNLLNNGQPWRRGDVVDIQLVFFALPLKVELIGGSLPPGLFFNSATRKIYGTVLALPKNITNYPVVFRATSVADTKKTFDRAFKWLVDPRDEEQSWQNGQAVQDLGSINRGANINIPLNISNPDADQLYYRILGVKSGIVGTFSGIPQGLSVDQAGPNILRIIGSPTITGNQPGTYYFKIYARDSEDLTKNPLGEGSPRTSEKVFKITILPEIVLDARLSDTVRWETAPGSLGSTYETYASHFSIKAVPQYEVNGKNSLETQTIRYSLVPSSLPLPDGLLLDTNTGLILGRCPYVTTNTTYQFTIEARVVFLNSTTGVIRPSSVASQRTFSITVRSIFGVDSVTTLQVSVPSNVRQRISQWIWGTLPEIRADEPNTVHQLTILGRENVFRSIDENFGKKRDYNILLAAGLNYSQDGSFLEKLKDYHHPSNWRIGKLSTARACDPEGQYLYDVLYLSIIDPMVGAGGFDAGGREVNLNRYAGSLKQTAIPQWNLKKEDSHFFPNSIRNLRLDMQSNRDRQDWPQANQPSATRGYGLVGREGLPLWMMCEQESSNPLSVLGYQPAIELVAVRAGSGAALVKILNQAGFTKDLEGTTITVDRYLLVSNGFTSSSFDFESSNGSITTFDGPDNSLNPTPQLTTFDRVLQSESKYYKFPPGDR